MNADLEELRRKIEAQSGRLMALEALTSKCLCFQFQLMQRDPATMGALITQIISEELKNQEHLSPLALNHALSAVENLVDAAVISCAAPKPFQVVKDNQE